MNNVTTDRIKPQKAKSINNNVPPKATENKNICSDAILKPTMTRYKVKGNTKRLLRNAAILTTSAMSDINFGSCFTFLSTSLIFQPLHSYCIIHLSHEEGNVRFFKQIVIVKAGKRACGDFGGKREMSV